MKQKQINKVLQSTLHLLVLIRESLRAEQALATPLGASVVAHAKLISDCLPNDMLMKPEDVKNIRRQAAVATLPVPEAEKTENKIVAPDGQPLVPSKGLRPGQMQILGGAVAEQVKRHL